MIDVRVISIGALSAHPLWNERQPVRVGHATCTLIRAGGANILVDPGLPEEAMAARLSERTGLKPKDITHVFLTSFRPDTHRGIGAFDEAQWLIAHAEREGVGIPMAGALRHAIERDNQELRKAIEHDVAVLQHCRPAPETLADGVDLFPLPGVSPGLCGLLVEQPEATLLVCGDAVPTSEHLSQGKILPWAADLALAKASFAEAIEIGDLLVLGRDNIVISPGALGEQPSEDDDAQNQDAHGPRSARAGAADEDDEDDED